MISLQSHGSRHLGETAFAFWLLQCYILYLVWAAFHRLPWFLSCTLGFCFSKTTTPNIKVVQDRNYCKTTLMFSSGQVRVNMPVTVQFCKGSATN